MTQTHSIAGLTKGEEDFCETTGVIGCLITLACLFQHLYFMEPHWINMVIILMYILTFSGYVLYARKHLFAPNVLVILAVLTFVLEMAMWYLQAISVVLMLLFLYSLFMAIWVKTSDIPAGLKAIQAARQNEDQQWDGIV